MVGLPAWQLFASFMSATLLHYYDLPTNFWQKMFSSFPGALVISPECSVDDGSVVAGDFLVALLSLSLLYALVHVGMSVFMASQKDVLAVGYDFASSVLISPALFYLYTVSFFALGTDLESRWFGMSRTVQTAMTLHVAENVLATVLYIPLKKGPEMYVHHALTIAGVSSSPLSG